MGIHQKEAELANQLEAAKKKIAELEKALADEQEHGKSFLEVFLGGEYIGRAEEKEKSATVTRAAATKENHLDSEKTADTLEKEARTWRQASDILRKAAASSFPRAQHILAAMDDLETPPQKSHLLLIALLLKLLAAHEGPRGLPKKIVAAAIRHRLNMSGLSKSSIEKMLAPARKIGEDHGLDA